MLLLACAHKAEPLTHPKRKPGELNSPGFSKTGHRGNDRDNPYYIMSSDGVKPSLLLRNLGAPSLFSGRGRSERS